MTVTWVQMVDAAIRVGVPLAIQADDPLAPGRKHLERWMLKIRQAPAPRPSGLALQKWMSGRLNEVARVRSLARVSSLTPSSDSAPPQNETGTWDLMKISEDAYNLLGDALETASQFVVAAGGTKKYPISKASREDAAKKAQNGAWYAIEGSERLIRDIINHASITQKAQKASPKSTEASFCAIMTLDAEIQESIRQGRSILEWPAEDRSRFVTLTVANCDARFPES